MKSGAGDDPFAQDDTDSEADSDTETTPSEDAWDESDSSSTTSADRRTSVQSLPYKYRRDSVKQGRTQQPIFLQSSTQDLIAETLDRVEDRFDEDVYKTDVVEAMVVAGGEETTPEAVLQRWGYGMKNR